MLLFAAACGGARRERRGTLQASVVRPPPSHDTVRFTAPAVAHRCGRGGAGGIVIEGVAGGNGVLLWVRSADSVGDGEYPPLPRGDSTTPRGAMVAVRWAPREDDARGVTLDSGTVAVTRTSGGFGAVARGSGLEPVAGQRVSLDIAFAGVPLVADTVSCAVQL